MTAAAFPSNVSASLPRLSLSRDTWTDAAFLAVATSLGLLGFEKTYGDWLFLLGAAIGVAAGIGMVIATLRYRLPIGVAFGGAAIAYFLLGGVVSIRAQATLGAVPTPLSLKLLAQTFVDGWRQLLTLLPPVGDESVLIVLPFAIGLAAGVIGLWLATRRRADIWPLAVPLGVLSLSVLFGTPTPASLTFQGALLGSVLLAWTSVRRSRGTIVTTARRARWRPLAGVVVLGVCTVAATVVGPRLPFAHSHHRVILRSYVQPPFDPNDYPSPLSSFRTYVNPKTLANKTLLTVSGLPAGARLRFATMDMYDGLAWGVTNGASGTAGAFQRVGSAIPSVTRGQKARVGVDLGDYSDVWLPSVGFTESVSFAGARAHELATNLRYNLATGTAAVLSGIGRGDRYTLEATVPEEPSQKALAGATPAGVPEAFTGVPPKVAAVAKSWAGAASPSWHQLEAVAARLRAGAYSDGTTAIVQSHPGHGEARISDFLSAPELVGDDEQYAAAFGLISTALGFPTRVVIGAIPERGGVVKGVDVHAWDEVDLTGLGWVPIDVTPPKSHRPNPNPPRFVTVNHTPTRVPPPVPANPPNAHSAADTSNSADLKAKRNHGAGHRIRIPHAVVIGVEAVGGTSAAILSLAFAILGLKSARRRRRRRSGTPAQRVAAAWLELVDVYVDLGAAKPGRTTRPQQALMISNELASFARGADAVVFGPHEPTESAASDFWSAVIATRDAALRAVGLRRGLMARLSVRSLHMARGSRPAARSTRPFASVS